MTDELSASNCARCARVTGAHAGTMTPAASTARTSAASWGFGGRGHGLVPFAKEGWAALTRERG